MSYLYDGEDILCLYSTGSDSACFTHGPGIDEPLAMTTPNGQNYYYHSEALGSIIAITDIDGSVVVDLTMRLQGRPKKVDK